MLIITADEVLEEYDSLTEDEKKNADSLVLEACMIIETMARDVDYDIAAVVIKRMIRRAMNTADSYPLGATQGSMSAGGYTQSWTIGSNGSSGELYVSKLEKKMLGVGDRIGSYSPLEEVICK